MLDKFITAIHSKNKVLLTFYSKEDGHQLKRIVAPMDYGASRTAKNKNPRYHFWDYDSDTKVHTLSLLPEQVKEIEVLVDKFEPSEFVTWTPKWIINRDWGTFS